MAQRTTLQITCTAELKAAVDDLARACGVNSTSDFLRPFVEELVEANHEKISLYREMIATPLVKPTGASDERSETQ